MGRACSGSVPGVRACGIARSYNRVTPRARGVSVGSDGGVVRVRRPVESVQ